MTDILVIEDHPDLRDGIVEQLSLAGFDVVSAVDGQAGIEMARGKLPDLIVCDVMMPIVDGYGVLAALHEEAITATIPFIFLTALADRRELRKGMELGANDYLTKPFTQAELLAAVHVALRKQKASETVYGQQSEELRNNLLRTLPHELNTPLSAILGYGEILVEDSDAFEPEEIRSMAQDIVLSGRRLQRLIENYLLFAQTEIVRMDPVRTSKLRQERFALGGDIVTQSARRKAAEVGREDDLQVETENVPLAIVGDSLRKIVEELVDNAFKFSKPGSAVVVQAAARDGMYVISVRDYGRGLTAEQVRQVGAYVQFERRLYEQQGMGLGLATVKSLTELFGGKVTIASEPQVSTEIQVELRLG